MKNFTLISNQKFNPRANDLPRSFIPGTFDEIENVKAHSMQTTGGIKCPPVLYKGQTIPAGNIGEREISY